MSRVIAVCAFATVGFSRERACAAPAAAAPMMCGNEHKSFQECVSNAGGDVSACQFYMDVLTKCKSRESLPS